MNFRRFKTAMPMLCIAALLCWAGPVGTQASEKAVLDLLVKKGVITKEEAAQAREEADAQMAKALEEMNKVKASSWMKSLTFYGDIRLRGEYFDFEKDPATSGDLNNDRLRFRMRLRLAAELKMQDWATIGVRLESGEQGGGGGLTTNPTSGTQTLTDDFSRKPIGIDLAYVALHPPQFEYIKLYGGKMLLPVWEPKFNSNMVWDNDVNPEGVGEQFEFKFGPREQYRVFLNAGQYALNEFAQDQNDAYFYDQEIGFEAKLNDHWKVTVAGGYYATHNLDNVEVSTASIINGEPTQIFNAGNATRTVGGKTFYLDDFSVWYGRAELVWTPNEKTFFGTPNQVALSGEYLKNASTHARSLTGANTSLDPDQTVGWTAQIAYGDNKKKGQWRLAYQYKVLEADSTIDFASDDDFGSGGTDRRGHIIEATYNVRDWWQVRAAAFVTEKITDRPNSGHNAFGFGGQDLFRGMLDTMFKF